MKRIKLTWEFRGSDAPKTAEHHKIHLGEYAAEHELLNCEVGVDVFSDVYQAAVMIIDETDLEKVKNELKPQRGFVMP